MILRPGGDIEWLFDEDAETLWMILGPIVLGMGFMGSASLASPSPFGSDTLDPFAYTPSGRTVSSELRGVLDK